MMNAIKKLLGSADAPSEDKLVSPDGEATALAPVEASDYEAWTPGTADTPAATDAAPANATIDAPEATASPEPEVSPADESQGTETAPDLETRIVDAIKLVYDPEIPVNIYELGLIYGVDIDENKDVHIQMTLTAPGCPVAGDMPGWVVVAVESNVEEVGKVDVELVWDPPWNPELMSEAAQLELGYF